METGPTTVQKRVICHQMTENGPVDGGPREQLLGAAAAERQKWPQGQRKPNSNRKGQRVRGTGVKHPLKASIRGAWQEGDTFKIQ